MAPRNAKPEINRAKTVRPDIDESPIIGPVEAGVGEGILGVPEAPIPDLDDDENNDREVRENVDFGCPH